MVNSISGSTQINQIFSKNKIQSQEIQEEKSKAQTYAPFNTAYVTPFINNVSYTQNEKEFMAYRDKFCEALKEVDTEYNKADWNFYINSTPENANTLNIVAGMYDELYSDQEAYNKFKEFNEKGIQDEKLKEHMDILLNNFASVLDIEETEELPQEVSDENNKRVSVDEISQIFNGFKPEIDGKKVTQEDISNIYKKSMDVELRKKHILQKTHQVMLLQIK